MKKIISALASRNIALIGTIKKSLTEQNVIIGYNFRYTSTLRSERNIFEANAVLLMSDICGEVVPHSHHFSIMLDQSAYIHKNSINGT